MSFLTKVSRLAKPGMFGAVAVAVAMTMAATYTTKLSMELDATLDAVDKARQDIDELETHRASLLNDIEGIAAYRDEMLRDMRDRMNKDILAGTYDGAVKIRHNALYGKADENAKADEE